MSKWTFDRNATRGGRFQVVITKPGVGAIDASVVRDVRTQIVSYSSADPFGDSTCVLQFPAITIYDDLNGAAFTDWLDDFSNVDIWWVPGANGLPVNWSSLTGNQWERDYRTWRNPLNESPEYAPLYDYSIFGNVATPTKHRGTKVWEGFIASMEFSSDSSGSNLQVQCQGALYQADRYLEKPFFPPNPQTMESLIEGVFDHKQRPNLRTQPLRIDWPAGWALVGPKYPKGGANTFTPNVRPGQKWTGYSTRQTGSWDHSLTSFVQDNLGVMITQDDSGVTAGNQWTLMHERENATRPGRQPVLLVRDRFADPVFEIWAGQPGVEISVTRDSTQMSNVIYGDGTAVDGSVWRNAVIDDQGERTDYLPLAYDRSVYPPHHNPLFKRSNFVCEAYNKYGTGFNQPAAVRSAQKTLKRDMDPGWSGTINLSVDVTKLDGTVMPRWLIQAGTPVRVKGMVGTGEAGMTFHIASVQANPQDGTVQLTVDTRFRDLLNLEEAIARNRDPLTPAKLLQVNRASAKVEDQMAPWDYSAGSGFIPFGSHALMSHKPDRITFPNEEWTRAHPPNAFPHCYVTVHADAAESRDRWTQKAVGILTSERGTIARTEVAAYDFNGNVLKIPFHMSVYYVNVTWRAMPYQGYGPHANYSPFQPGAFQTIDAATGEAYPKGNFLKPQDTFIIGWGDHDEKAGYSPGSYSAGNKPTGLLEDDSQWNFDQVSAGKFDILQPVGVQHQQRSAVLVYVMFYAEYTEPVHFQGRFYRLNPGT